MMRNPSILRNVAAAALLFALCLPLCAQAPWRSRLYPEDWVPPVTTPFTEPMLQDFSYAGAYEGRPLPLRTGPVFDAVATYGADPSGARDSTAAIQRAIDDAGAAGGGVVLLPEGTFRFQTEDNVGLRLNHSNVVLRGAGTNRTFLLNVTTAMRGKTTIFLGFSTRGGWQDIAGTPVRLSADVLTPTNRIPVVDSSGFSPGDPIVLRTSLTSEFIDEVGMTGLWQEADNRIFGVVFFRRVVNVEPGILTIDTPARFYLKMRDDARAYRASAIIENSGIEDLSIGDLQHPGNGLGMRDFVIPGTAAYDVHGSHFIDIHRARNVWLKNVSTFRPPQNTSDIHILSNAVRVRDAAHVTLKNVHVSRPQYLGEGGNGYGFQIDSQETLLQDCSSSFQRHGITFSGMQSSGNVVHRCTIAQSKKSPNGGGSDFHRFLSQSCLIDNLTLDEDFFAARYRSAGNPTHGVTSTQSVFYNSRGLAYHPRRQFIVVSAQAFQGYIIGTSGPASNAIAPDDERTGATDWIEGVGEGAALTPVSLYASQLSKRNNMRAVDRITVSASQADHPGEHTMDNDLSTRWAAEGLGQSITYDLGEAHTLGSVGIAFYRGDERTARVEIATSLDGTTWTAPLTVQSSGTTNDIQNFDLEDRRARYVRITSLGNSQNDAAAITEVAIYGN